MTFYIEEDINLWSASLLDVLSDKALEISSHLPFSKNMENTHAVHASDSKNWGW